MPADFPAHRSTERRPARPVPLGLIAALALGIAVVGCASSAKTPQIIYITPSPSPTTRANAHARDHPVADAEA